MILPYLYSMGHLANAEDITIGYEIVQKGRSFKLLGGNLLATIAKFTAIFILNVLRALFQDG